ncbi:MAG: hypothetical protein KF847_11370 [Pirellulales bacterium]|nr:hypothetical protein [Pirellulales bacterium]
MRLSRVARLCAPGRISALLACVALAASVARAQNVTLSGYVYIDRNNDGLLAFNDQLHPELIIPGVTIQLFAGGVAGSPLDTAVTDAMGMYSFANLAPGTYSLRQVQPVEYVNGLASLGQIRDAITMNLDPVGSSIGTTAVDSVGDIFTNILLPANSRGDLYNFGELGLAPAYVSKRQLMGTANPPSFTPTPTFTPADVPEPTGAALAVAALAGWRSLAGRRKSSAKRS